MISNDPDGVPHNLLKQKKDPIFRASKNESIFLLKHLGPSFELCSWTCLRDLWFSVRCSDLIIIRRRKCKIIQRGWKRLADEGYKAETVAPRTPCLCIDSVNYCVVLDLCGLVHCQMREEAELWEVSCRPHRSLIAVYLCELTMITLTLLKSISQLRKSIFLSCSSHDLTASSL